MRQHSIDSATERWVVADPRPGQRRVRLILLPHAGGGANTYRLWPAMMPPGVDVRPVQLPGRERRFSELPIARMDTLLDALVPALLPLFDLPFALFGHSMGACIAHALALRLADLGLPRPCLLIASGREAPHLPRRQPSLHTLAEPDFLDSLRRLNGTPPEVLENRELLDLVMPMLRADFTLAEEYRSGPARLDCPIIVLGGETDTETTPDGLAAWSARTTAATSVAMLPGGHFFTDTARAAVVDQVTAALRQYDRDG